MNKNIAIIVVLIILLLTASISAGVYYFKEGTQKEGTQKEGTQKEAPLKETPTTPSSSGGTSSTKPKKKTTTSTIDDSSPTLNLDQPTIGTITPSSTGGVRPSSGGSTQPSSIPTNSGGTSGTLGSGIPFVNSPTGGIGNTYGTPSTANNSNSLNNSTVDCKNIGNYNSFCAAPDKFMDTCMSPISGTPNDPASIATKLKECRQHLDILERGPYELVRSKLIALMPYLGDPKNANYLGPYPSVECTGVDDWSNFCLRPDKFIESCTTMGIGSSYSPEIMSNKLRDCASNHKESLSKDSYNKARDALIELLPYLGDFNSIHYLPPYPSVDCTQLNNWGMFCLKPDEFMDSCMNMGTNPPHIIANKLNDCKNNHYERLTKEKYDKVRDTLIGLVPSYGDPKNSDYISPFPSIDCKYIDHWTQYCSKPDKFIESCLDVRNQSKYSINVLGSKLKDCRTNHVQSLNQDTYESARALLIELNPDFNDINNPIYLGPFPTVNKCTDISTPNSFCPSPEKYVYSCVDGRDFKPENIAHNLRDCRSNHFEMLNQDTYNEARDLLINLNPSIGDENSKDYLPKFPSVNCGNITNWRQFCNTPDKFLDDCIDPVYNTPNFIAGLFNSCRYDHPDMLPNQETYDKIRNKLISLNPSLGDTTNSNYLKPYPDVNCTQVDNLNMFCPDVDKYVNSCMRIGDDGNSNSPYYISKNLQSCFRTKYSLLDQQKYNNVRQQLVSLRPEYNDKTSDKYIPPYTGIDCSKLYSVDFCQDPNAYIDNCVNKSIIGNAGMTTADSTFSKRLTYCVTKQFDITNKDSYNTARQKYVQKDPKYNDKSSSDYIPSYINCNKEDDRNYFCQDPDNYITNCNSTRGTSAEQVYTQKLKDCIVNASQIIGTDNNTKNSYEKARQRYMSNNRYSDPNSTNYIPPYIEGIYCDKENDLTFFCKDPDNYINNCSGFKGSSAEQVYTQKLKACIEQKPDIVGTNNDTINSNNKARQRYMSNNMFSDPNSYSYIPSYIKDVVCKNDKDPITFCKDPTKIINSCTDVEGSDQPFKTILQTCTKNNFSITNKDSYNIARQSFIQKDSKYENQSSLDYIPPYKDGIDCDKYKNLDLFCKDPNSYIETCSFFEGTNSDNTFTSQLKACIDTKYNIIATDNNSKDSYEIARRKYITKDPKYNDKNSPSYIPPYIEGDCSKQDVQSIFCKDPSIFIDNCSYKKTSPESDYKLKLQDCVINNFKYIGTDSKSKTSYENARQKYVTKDRKYNDPNTLDYIPPYVDGYTQNIDCSKQDDPNAFCQDPKTYINSCSYLDGEFNNDLKYPRKVKDCINNYSININNTNYVKDSYEIARRKYMLKDPKYNDKSSQFYIPPYIEGVNCSKQNDPNFFCKKPNTFMNICSGVITTSAGNNYPKKLQDCNSNYNDITNKDEYIAARNALISSNPQYNDPLSKDYISPYDSISCKKETDNTYFCKDPLSYFNKCKNNNHGGVDIATFYTRKVKDCLLSDLSSYTKEADYNIIKNDINTIDPRTKNPIYDTYLPPFPKIDCSNIETPSTKLNFCDYAGDYVTTCAPLISYTKDSINKIFPPLLKPCINENWNIKNKDQYNKARDYIRPKNPNVDIPDYTYFLPTFPLMNCNTKVENINDLNTYVATCNSVSINDKIAFMKTKALSPDINPDDYTKARESIKSLLITTYGANAGGNIDLESSSQYIPKIPKVVCDAITNNRNNDMISYISSTCDYINYQDKVNFLNQKSNDPNVNIEQYNSARDILKTYLVNVKKWSSEYIDTKTKFLESYYIPILPKIVCDSYKNNDMVAYINSDCISYQEKVVYLRQKYNDPSINKTQYNSARDILKTYLVNVEMWTPEYIDNLTPFVEQFYIPKFSISTPSQRLKFSNYNSLMKSMRINI